MSFEELMDHAAQITVNAHVAAVRMDSPPRYGPQWWDNLRQMCEEVPKRFEPFSQLPRPDDYDAAINHVKKALHKLSNGEDNQDPISTNESVYIANTELTKLSGMESYIAGWTGKAAVEFKANFVDPFPAVVRNQFIIVAALKSALEAEQAMWKAMRENVDKIAHDTLTALDNMGESGSNEWTMVFTVISSVAAVAAVPLTGGASVLTVTAIGAAAQVVAAAAPEDSPKLQVSGEHADQVLASMFECLNKLQEEIDRTDRKISDALADLIGSVYAERDSFVSKRPALAGATKQNIRSPEQMGYSSD